MSRHSNHVQGIELRDAAGQSLGVYCPAEVVKEMAAECEDMRKQLAAVSARLLVLEETAKNLAVQHDRMSAETTLLRKERDEFRKVVHFLTQREFAFTQEDIVEAEKNGITFDAVIGKLEELT